MKTSFSLLSIISTTFTLPILELNQFKVTVPSKDCGLSDQIYIDLGYHMFTSTLPCELASLKGLPSAYLKSSQLTCTFL